MPVKEYKPTTPSRRGMSGYTFEEITKDKPEKSLTKKLNKKSGRNNNGRITVRRKGGGHKQKYRVIDFKRDKDGVPAKVASVEYDPNRSCRIALLNYKDGEKRYIICPVGLKTGDSILSGIDADIKPGNSKKLKDIPLGTVVHCVEMKPGKGAQLARSAGVSIQLVGKEGKYAYLQMPSGEVRLVLQECKASIGQVGNPEHMNITLGKAGRNRWLGKRPKVRGVVMNPVDHPMGGGEGRSSGGRHPCTPWGKPTKGYKTRKNKTSDKLIIKRRKGK